MNRQDRVEIMGSMNRMSRINRLIRMNSMNLMNLMKHMMYIFGRGYFVTANNTALRSLIPHALITWRSIENTLINETYSNKKSLTGYIGYFRLN
jgi:hypothetical protein